MVNLREIYRCEICGAVVEVVNAAKGVISCCGKPMTKMDAQTADMSLEKHVPIIKKVDGGILVKVGSTEHPMTEQHYITFIEVMTNDNKVGRAELTPNDKPEAFFNLDFDDVIEVREYCNIHGLWKA